MSRHVLTAVAIALTLVASGAVAAFAFIALQAGSESGPQVGAELGELRALTYEYALLTQTGATDAERKRVVGRFEDRLEALRPTLRARLGTAEPLDSVAFAFDRLAVAEDATTQSQAAASTVASVNAAIEELERAVADAATRTRMWLFGTMFALILGLGAASLYLVRSVRTERRATRELTLAAQRLQAILDNAQNAVTIVDQDGTVRFANPALSQLVGIPLAELLGAPAGRFVDPDQLVRVSEIRLARMRGESAPRRYARTLTHVDGHAVHVDSMATVIDYLGERMVLVEHRDIGPELEARRSAEQNAARLGLILDTVPDVIWVAQADGTVTHVNRAVTELLGYEGEALIGRHVGTLFDEFEDGDHLAQYFQRPSLLPLQIPEHTVVARASDHAHIPVDLRVTTASIEGSPFLVGVLRDARPRQRAEEDRMLAQRVVVRSDFLATMSHELRTPLHAIMGFAEVLGDEVGGTLTERQHGYVGHITEASNLLLSLIEDVLDMARIDAGKYRLTPGDFSPAEVLLMAVETVRRQAQLKGLDLRMDVDDAPGHWTGDRRALVQIAVNLIANAIKFTPAGHVDVSVSGATPLVLRVADTGTGIATEDIERIFEPFEQAGMRRSGPPGTGLGLAIVRRLAMLHGGDVSVDSVPGEGSEFVVHLMPLSSPPAKLEASDG
ncbi:MAG: hypothetical protein CVU47_04825 [Chloroflexi bacterium HGW-Chloroflexi-9]|nr:MAG: hypothetical protein CVU47_04825 [Chloroflexi bacterium HGW-Chloroflexi-9]